MDILCEQESRFLLIDTINNNKFTIDICGVSDAHIEECEYAPLYGVRKVTRCIRGAFHIENMYCGIETKIYL